MLKTLKTVVIESVFAMAALFGIMMIIIVPSAMLEDQTIGLRLFRLVLFACSAAFLWFYLFKWHQPFKRKWVRYLAMVPLAMLSAVALTVNNNIAISVPFFGMFWVVVYYHMKLQSAEHRKRIDDFNRDKFLE